MSDNDYEDDVPHKRKQSSKEEETTKKQLKLPQHDEEEPEEVEEVEEQEQEEAEEEKINKKNRKRRKKEEEGDGDHQESSVSRDKKPKHAKPIGKQISESGNGRDKRTQYKSFKYDGKSYQREDPVLLKPSISKDKLKAKRSLRKKDFTPMDVIKKKEEGIRSPNQKLETAGSSPNNALEYHSILAHFKVLTGESRRDKFLEKLLKSIEKHLQSEKSFVWPGDAVPAVVSLEKASHESLYSNYKKYAEKMRQLVFNLKQSARLARRLINRDLEPSKIVSMSSYELQTGKTAEELKKKERNEPERKQEGAIAEDSRNKFWVNDVRCPKCPNKTQVFLRGTIAPPRERYELQCDKCDEIWRAFPDDVHIS